MKDVGEGDIKDARDSNDLATSSKAVDGDIEL